MYSVVTDICTYCLCVCVHVLRMTLFCVLILTVCVCVCVCMGVCVCVCVCVCVVREVKGASVRSPLVKIVIICTSIFIRSKHLILVYVVKCKIYLKMGGHDDQPIPKLVKHLDKLVGHSYKLLEHAI